MNVLKRILQLREERGWTEYKLSVESGIPQSTISSWFRKDVQPSLVSLEAICRAFGITLSQFFSPAEMFSSQLSPQQARMLSAFCLLTPQQQEGLLVFLEAFKKQ